MSGWVKILYPNRHSSSKIKLLTLYLLGNHSEMITLKLVDSPGS